MQTDNITGFDDLSQKSRKQLKAQIARVQKEGRKLRAQVSRLSQAESAEIKQRKQLLEQVAASGKDLGQSILQRGNELATSGMSLAGDQLRSGQRKALEYGGGLVQGASQFSNQAAQNLTDWGGDTSSGLRKQGRQLSHSASDWGDETTYRLRKQGRQLAHNTSDWGDDTTYRLRKQGQTLFQNAADWAEELAYQLRHQARKMSNTLVERKEDTAHQLHLQKRNLGRNLTGRRDDTAHQLRRQARALGRNFSERRDDTTRQLRKQRDYLSERGGQLLEPVRDNKFWSILGFVSGLLLAGGMTYWLVRRNLVKSEPQTEDGIELETREPLNGAVYHPAGEIRAVGQGGTTVVVTRPATSAGSTTRFVGVVSSRRYYPLERQPDARDLVFFDSEEDAHSEGFTPAD